MMTPRPTGRWAVANIGPIELVVGFLLLVLVAVAVIVVVVTLVVRHVRRRTAVAPGSALETRLAELDSLRSRGVISEREYEVARTRTLEGFTTS